MAERAADKAQQAYDVARTVVLKALEPRIPLPSARGASSSAVIPSGNAASRNVRTGFGAWRSETVTRCSWRHWSESRHAATSAAQASFDESPAR